MFDEGYKGEVYRSGRWLWTIRVTHGPLVIGDPMYGCPRAFGRKRAEKKARRIMTKLTRDDARRQERHPVHIDGQAPPQPWSDSQVEAHIENAHIDGGGGDD